MARATAPRRTHTCSYCGTAHASKTDWLVCVTACQSASTVRVARPVSCWQCGNDVPTAGEGRGVCVACGWTHAGVLATEPDATRVQMIGG